MEGCGPQAVLRLPAAGIGRQLRCMQHSVAEGRRRRGERERPRSHFQAWPECIRWRAAPELCFGCDSWLAPTEFGKGELVWVLPEGEAATGRRGPPGLRARRT